MLNLYRISSAIKYYQWEFKTKDNNDIYEKKSIKRNSEAIHLTGQSVTLDVRYGSGLWVAGKTNSGREGGWEVVGRKHSRKKHVHSLARTRATITSFWNTSVMVA